MAVEAEVTLGGREADEDRAVDLGRQQGGRENAGEVEPLAAEPHSLAGIDAVDPEPLGRGGAEHRDRLLRGGGVQIAAGRDRGADRRRQAQAGGLDGDGVRVHGRDEGAAVDVGAGGARFLHLRHRADAGDHPGRGERQLGRLAEQGLAVGDGEQVGAELVDLAEQAGLGGGGEAEHGDDRGDADGDAECRQRCPDASSAQADAGDAGEVGDT